MQSLHPWRTYVVFCLFTFFLSSCATHTPEADFDTPPESSSLPNDAAGNFPYSASYDESKYADRLPRHVDLGTEKVILVDPKLFAWGAYDEEGNFVRGGIATAGANFCPDIGRPCRTKIGTFRLYSLGNEDCASHIYPRPTGGALMPYCLFFNGGQSLHGSPDRMLAEANISHGCVHIRIPDAEWLRKDFADVGTKVVIMPY